MDAYLIKIDDKYFVDTNDEDFGKVPVGGWYDEGINIGGVVLSDNLDEAKRIEGNINLIQRKRSNSRTGIQKKNSCIYRRTIRVSK